MVPMPTRVTDSTAMGCYNVMYSGCVRVLVPGCRNHPLLVQMAFGQVWQRKTAQQLAMTAADN